MPETVDHNLAIWQSCTYNLINLLKMLKNVLTKQ